MKNDHKNLKNITTKSKNMIDEQKKIISYTRQKSMKNFRLSEKNEKIIPLKRKIKSREKEIKGIQIFPIIKKNSFNSKQRINNIPKPKNINIKKKDSSILPNLKDRIPINNIKIKPEINNINIINNKEKYNINENKQNNSLDKNKLEFIIRLYEEFLDLSNSIPNKNLFNPLINNFNKKYLLHYSSNNSINQIEDTKFIESLKYSFIIIASLIFLPKDEVSYKFNSQRLKELLDQFIFISLKNMKINPTTKIKMFINRMNPTKKSYNNSLNAIIKLLYNNKCEYTSLKNALNQLVTNINKFNILELSNIINNTILYCLNHQNIKSKNILFNNSVSSNIKDKNNKKKNNFNKNIKETNQNQNNNDELIPTAPYIKTKLTKKFCLVLDIDETITHTLKTPFGDYFLVRPGVKEFLEEMIKYFEIVIFTSSPKSYADNILDKIDINNEFFSYRLYRKHVIYENGNSVKKLDMIGRDLKKIVFVDNLKSNAKYNPDNLYHIKTWSYDINDNELIILKNKLKNIATSGNYDNDITKGLYNL